MKLTTSQNILAHINGEQNLVPHHPAPIHGTPIPPPMPPHLSHAAIRLEFDEHDWETLCAVFGDEDTASTAVQIIHRAPPEMKILVFQLINSTVQCADSAPDDDAASAHKARWSNPFFDPQTQETYVDLYKNAGEQFMRILETAPYEIAVISRLIVYLKTRKEVA